MKHDHNLRIEKIANMITIDNVAIDEHDQNKLKKYIDFAKENYGLNDGNATELINEAFLYLKLKEGIDIDP